MEGLLEELDRLIAELFERDPEDWGELLDELVPELTELCENVWLLELIVDYCNRRAKRA